jgi:hypothetical protein
MWYRRPVVVVAEDLLGVVAMDSLFANIVVPNSNDQRRRGIHVMARNQVVQRLSTATDSRILGFIVCRSDRLNYSESWVSERVNHWESCDQL